MRINKGLRTKLIVTLLAAVLLIAAFAFCVHLIEEHGLLDEALGDSGDWGGDDDDYIELELADKLYISSDDVNTYLIIGTDAGGEDLGEMYSGELADFLALLIIDNTTEKFAFMQIDRNSMVPMQVPDKKGNMNAISTQQLCISHWYGRDQQEHDLNTVNAVSTFLGGLEADNYYTLNMADIGAVNHAIGGVQVDIDTDMTNIDPEFVAGSSVLLTDEQAEKFVRARMTVGDGSNKGRMSRQTQYMQKAYNLVMNQIRENPEYINDLYAELKGKIESGDSSRSFSQMTNQLMTYESCGILQFSGRTEVNDTQGDGIEHEEFYVDERSIVNNFHKVMNLKEAPEDYDYEEE